MGIQRGGVENLGTTAVGTSTDPVWRPDNLPRTWHAIVSGEDAEAAHETPITGPRFDGLLARATTRPLTERERGAFSVLSDMDLDASSPAALYTIDPAGYILPQPLVYGNRARAIVLAGDVRDALTIARPGEVRRRRLVAGDYIDLTGEGWWWLSPTVAPSTLLLLQGHEYAHTISASPSPSIAPVRVIPGALPEASAIAEAALLRAAAFLRYPRSSSRRPFDPWRGSEYEDDDCYRVLPMDAMDADLRRAIAAAIAPHTPSGRLYFQVNLYLEGDHVLPHRDDFPQGLFLLTDSHDDGLVVQSDDGFLRVEDVAGTAIHADPRAWHWVDPVARAPRLSLITIPPLRIGQPP